MTCASGRSLASVGAAQLVLFKRLSCPVCFAFSFVHVLEQEQLGLYLAVNALDGTFAVHTCDNLWSRLTTYHLARDESAQRAGDIGYDLITAESRVDISPRSRLHSLRR